MNSAHFMILVAALKTEVGRYGTKLRHDGWSDNSDKFLRFVALQGLYMSQAKKSPINLLHHRLNHLNHAWKTMKKHTMIMKDLIE